jgi:hypothetical protein
MKGLEAAALLFIMWGEVIRGLKGCVLPPVTMKGAVAANTKSAQSKAPAKRRGSSRDIDPYYF